jgi:osmotically-inducible protein OsmY
MNESQSGTTLETRIERALEARAGVNAIVEIKDGEITLSGTVDTAEARQAAADVVAELAPRLRLTNDLEVETVLPAEPSDLYGGSVSDAPPAEGATGEPAESLEALAAREGEIDPDFTDQPLSTSGLESAGVDLEEEQEDTVFFPPTDPVITTDSRGDTQVLGGFSATSEDDVSVDRSASDGEFGDEAIADAVRRELLEDAATTDLEIDVDVREGVVYLRGSVQGVTDAENAEEVAGRVPGVQEVQEELRVVDV